MKVDAIVNYFIDISNKHFWRFRGFASTNMGGILIDFLGWI